MKVLTEASLAFDRCNQQCRPEWWSSNQSGDLTGCLKQVVVFDLKCLFPDGSYDPLTALDDGVGSEVQGDSKKSQS